MKSVPFTWVWLYPLCCQVLYHGTSMIVTRFTSFTENFFDLRLWSHQNFPLWTRLYQHVFCRKPSLFSSLSRYRNVGPSECACRHYAYSNQVPLLLATPLLNHDKNWKCFGIHAQGFPMALKDYVHRLNSLWTPTSQSGNSCNRSLYTSSHPYFFVSGFCWFRHRVSP